MSLELGEGLRTISQDIIFITSEWGSKDFAGRLRAKEMPFYRMRLGFISATINIKNFGMTAHQLLYWPKLMVDWSSFLRREKPAAVIHTNWHHMLLLWPWLSVERDVFWVHDILPNTPRYARFFTSLSRRIVCFATVSEAVARALRDLGIADQKINIIHNGIKDPSAGTPVVARRDSEVGIGIVGAVGEWKGHEDLLNAFARLSRNYPNVILSIFGGDDKPYAVKLKDQANALGVGDRISWQGFVTDRSKIYSTLDICVVPSRCEEALPTTAIEAAYFGLPVVATRKGGLPEIVVDGETGFIVEAENPDQLSRRLEELVRDATLRANMGAAARQRALAFFGCDRFSEQFLNLFKKTFKAKCAN